METPEEQADLSILFVADGARLERQSWLLASSLARAHASGPRPRIHAYVSREWLPKVSALTRDLYEACGVALRPLPDPPQWRAPYPHGNKMVAATDSRDTSRSVFLDTDMVCCKTLAGLADLPDDTIAAAPEGVPTWGGNDDRWERAYAHFGLPFPEERVRLLRGRRKMFVPYFNAGLVAFPDRPTGGARPFAERWVETAIDFDHGCSIGGKRPWLDQISLPLTIARFGYRTRVLEEDWNYSLSRRKDHERTRGARILHYHRFRFLAQAPQWPELLEDFIARLSRRHRQEAEAMLAEAGLIPR